MSLPHEVQRLGASVQSWVEKQLLNDLRHYGIERQDIRFDWSQVVQEGHYTDFRGRMLESLSEILIRDTENNVLAEGWMDFVITGDSGKTEPRLFWLFLSVAADGKMVTLKENSYLPDHLWNALADSEKTYVATTQSKWLERDPKIQAWKRNRS